MTTRPLPRSIQPDCTFRLPHYHFIALCIQSGVLDNECGCKTDPDWTRRMNTHWRLLDVSDRWKLSLWADRSLDNTLETHRYRIMMRSRGETA